MELGVLVHKNFVLFENILLICLVARHEQDNSIVRH